MIFKTIKTTIKLIVLASLIILILGYPMVIHEANPFIFYYEWIGKIIEGIGQFRSST